MDGFRDRFGSRYDRNTGRSSAGSSRSGMERDRGSMDRGNDRSFEYGGRNDYAERDDYNRRPAQQSSMMGGGSGMGMDNAGGGLNGRQLEIIRDYFDETKDDNKEILHAVDNNAKMLDRGLDILGELKDKADRAKEPASVDFTGLIGKLEDSGKANKETIINAIAGNTDLLNLIREELTKTSEAVSAMGDEEEGGEALDREEIEKLFSDLQDHVHKENVKCYRNVAGALEEQEKRADEKSGGLGVVKIFSIIQLALTVLNIVLLALYIFRVI